jgi:hypothetical protein
MKSYIFQVKLTGHGRVWRKILMRGDQTLEELHIAIQDAYGWDSDHLYSFFMSGRAWDYQSEYCIPDAPDAWGFDMDEGESEEEERVRTLSPEETRQAMDVLLDDELTTEEKRAALGPLWDLLVDEEPPLAPNDVRGVKLESLDLHAGQEFLYLFDYGNEHRFKIRVTGVELDAPDGRYPRIVESVGRAPDQYPTWEGEDLLTSDAGK